ncbi:hypothetical protein PZB75_13475 [Streptomyces sp. AM 4-1-1]|uniref:hypothetical protein n=1 Tax=Streptomyces sp. AM 4-1-1 TaxID=3028710 RepID=UPI0023B8A669|nr:hypothetical protein [Streptomyces sp. AM 4-1-1]WEH34282.1 hypothetical protein PZB75_13475 [Streptomyces sp. AM 4-1-1]
MKGLRSSWPALLVNLLVGIPAMVPLYSLWWLSERRWGGPAIDRSSTIVEVCGADCGRTDLAMWTATASGLLVLLLVAVADVIVPLHRDRPLGAWLRAMPVALVPFLVFQAISSAL